MKALVTGGAGMIGSHLVDALLAHGDRVIVLDNFLTGRRENLAQHANNPHLDVVAADVASSHLALRHIAAIDRVYHLASPASPVDFSRYPLETLMTNATGTWSALQVARRCRARFLLASTSEVYGEPAEHPQAESYRGNVTTLGPRACYDEGKRFAESLTISFARAHGLDARIVRLFNTYGPRSRIDDGRVVPAFCVQALSGLPLTVFGTGEQTRSLCYVADIVRGLLSAMETDAANGQAINLGCPEEHSVLDIARIIRSLVASRSPIAWRPLPKDDPTRRCPDIAKAQHLLGWSPQVSLEAGLEQTLTYFRHELATDGAVRLLGAEREHLPQAPLAATGS